MKKMEFGIRKMNCEFHKQQRQSSQVMCALVSVACPSSTAAGPFTQPSPVCACGFPGSLPWLTSSPPQTGCAAAEGSVPLTGWILQAHSFILPVQSNLHDVTVPGTYLPFKCV